MSCHPARLAACRRNVPFLSPRFFGGMMIPALGAASLLLVLIFGQTASAGIPGKLFKERDIMLAAFSPSSAETRDPENGQTDSDNAIAAISGSPWPGIIDHLLQRPVPDETGNAAQANIHINYPSIGNRKIDAEIRSWVCEIADAFEEHLDMEHLAKADCGNELDNEIDNILKNGVSLDMPSGDPDNGLDMFELWGSYTVSRPSGGAVSITFELWNYIRNGQRNLDIITLNFSLLTGQRLVFVDIFEKPEVALKLMSSWSRKQLATRLGAARREQTLNDGTEPLAENFSSLTLTPGGICINFQPYQVGPWEVGIQKVEMPLEELMPSSPLLALWGK